MEEQGSKTQLERVLAALAHASILLCVPLSIIGDIIVGEGAGIGVALAIWLVMKGKSAYVRGQALQAVVYQVAVVVFYWVGSIVWMLLLIGPLQIDIVHPTRWVLPTLIAVPMGIQVLASLYALWGAVRCLGGHDFRYAIVGKLVRRWI